MSTRLQVIVDEAELDRYRQAAHAEGLTVSEWVRRTLASSEQDASRVEPADRLAAIRAAAAHTFPIGDIDDVLAEIEQGYLAGQEDR